MKLETKVFGTSEILAIILLVLIALFARPASAAGGLHLGQVADHPEQWRLTQILDGWALFKNDTFERFNEGYWLAVELKSLKEQPRLRRGENLMFAPWPACFDRLTDVMTENTHGFPLRIRRLRGRYDCR